MNQPETTVPNGVSVFPCQSWDHFVGEEAAPGTSEKTNTLLYLLGDRLYGA